jgi:hypothetical protein
MALIIPQSRGRRGRTAGTGYNPVMPGSPIKVLLQTTIPTTADDWCIARFICDLGGVGEAHHFHSRNLDPDAARCAPDDTITTSISWPNFHSGANGDYQEIRAIAPLHPVLTNPNAAGGAIRFLPAHPHEGDVSAPANQDAKRTT